MALRPLLFCFVVGVLFDVTVASAAPPSDEATRRAVHRAVQSGRHQMELPRATRVVPNPSVEPRVEQAPSDPPPQSGPEGLSNFTTLLIWFGVAIAAGAFLVPALIDLLQRRFGVRPGTAVTSHARKTEPQGDLTTGLVLADDPAAQARSLVAQGRALEALHVLVLGAIRLVERQAHVPKFRSLTNREIATTLADNAAGARAFGALVGVAEIVTFGGRTPQLQDVEACCLSFADLQASLRRDADGG